MKRIYVGKRLLLSLTFAATAMSFVACGNDGEEADAHGVFYATEIIVSAESNGKLLEFNVQEGKTYQAGDLLGYTDTMDLALQIQQLEVKIRATMASRPDIPSQLNTLQAQLQTMERERNRVATLVDANAATTKQLDDVDAQIKILKSQISATKSTLGTQSAAILENVEAMRIQMARLQNGLDKCKITAPITGTVLKKYIEPNELAYPGKPLFKIADITNMSIKVYVTEDQLSSIKVGQSADIRIDTESGTDRVIKGKVSWISDKAEFTPKMIVTKKERANMVYAVKISFKNDGTAKIGMPGDVVFKK